MSRVQGKVKLKILRMGGVIHVFWVGFSSRTRKMAQNTFWTAQIQQILQIGRMQKSPEVAWKMAVFDLGKAKTQTFFPDIYFKFCTQTHMRGLLHIYSGFWKIRKLSLIFLNNIFCWLFLKIFNIFKIVNIRQSSLLATCIINILLKTNRFYRLKWLRDSVSR